MSAEPAEAELPARGSSRRTAWLDPKLIIPLAQALIVLLVGWWIKDSVSLSLTRKQLDLANVTQMHGLIQALSKPKQNLYEDYYPAAMALAPFGAYAITTFLQLEQVVPDANQQAAIEAGLRAVALQEPEEMIAQLRRIIRNRSGFYSYTAHLFAIRTLAEMGDRKSLQDLMAYQAELTGIGSDSLRVRALGNIVSPNKPVGEAELQKLMESLESSIVALRQEGTGRQ